MEFAGIINPDLVAIVTLIIYALIVHTKFYYKETPSVIHCKPELADISAGNSINSIFEVFNGVGELKAILRSAYWFTKFELDVNVTAVILAPYTIVKDRSVVT